MTEPRDYHDSELSHIYKEGGWPEPSRQIDQAILAASRRALQQRSFSRRWGPSLALAATVVLTFTLFLRVSDEQPDGTMVAPPILDERPAAPAAESKPAKPTKLAPLRESAPIPKSAPAPQSAPKQEPAPAAPAVALKKEAPEAARADRVEPAAEKREKTPALGSALQFERQAKTRALMSTPARANDPPSSQPAPAPAPSAADASVGTAGLGARVGVSAERSPQAWLQDIRRLRTEGKTEEAARELAEFRKRHPDYNVPEDLR